MLKKLLAIALLLFITFAYVPQVFNPTPVQAALGADESSNLDSGEFTFQLGGTSVNPDATGIVHSDINPQKWIRRGINYIFERVIGVLAASIGGLSVLMMSVGGFLILSSAGNENQYQKGTNYIKYSAIGLAVALGAYIIVTAVQLVVKSLYG